MGKVPFRFPSIPWRTYLAHGQHYGLALAIFFIGILVSIAFFLFYQIQDNTRNQAEFNRLADVRLVLIQEMLQGTVDQLKSIKQFYYASDLVTQKDFHTFVHFSLNRYPNLLAIGWIPFLNNPSYQKQQALYFIPLKESAALNNQALGFEYLEFGSPDPFYIDLDTYADVQRLIQQATDSSSFLISDTVTYFQNGLHQGFFLLDPLNLENAPSLSEATRHLKGLLIGFSDFDRLIQFIRTRLKPIGINIQIYDGQDKLKKILYSNPSSLDSALSDKPSTQFYQQQWTRYLTLPVGNRTWTIEATPSAFFIQQYLSWWRHWEVLITGFLISALSGIYFLVLTNHHILIEQEVHKRTEELAHTNRLLQQEVREKERIEEISTQKQNYLQNWHEALEYLTKFTILEFKKAIHEVTVQTAKVMQIDRVSVWLYQEENEHHLLSCQGLYTLSIQTFSDRLEFLSTYFPTYFKALMTHSHLIIPSQENNELNQELQPYLVTFHIIAKLDIPIVFKGKLLGVLCCEETRNERVWVLEDRHFGQTIADIVAIIIEQSARQKAEKALLKSEERLRFITQKAIDAIISVTDNGNIVSWNEGAEKMFGYFEAEIQNRPLNLILPQRNKRPLEAAAKPIEMTGMHKEGYFFPVEVSYTRWKSGTLYFDTVIIRDITERKDYETRLIQAIQEAKAANAAKSNFLTTISHELRTPLNAIIGFNQCLLMRMDGPINEQQETSLKRIEKSSLHLLNLINNILDSAKAETNKIELEITSCDISELLASCIEDIRPLAQSKNLKIELAIHNPHILIEADQTRIHQVLLNLLGNAVKFTDEGSILAQLLNYPQYIEIRLVDTGIGLSSEEISKIFKPFAQADSSVTRKYGGTGLGLAISKKIIDLHGGTIEVQSQKGKGSLFIVTLPKIQ